MPALVLAQPRIAVSLDTIAMTIGEDIRYQIEVQTDSTAQVIFPQGQTFLPFEIIDTTKVDIQKLLDKALWKRTYTLIQFDSGSYHIPRQRILVDGKSIFTDSLKMEVFTMEVDTLKQPLHPIKPIIETQKNRTGWWRPYTLAFLLLGTLLGLYVLYGRAREKIQKRRQKLPPFDRALQKLKALEANTLAAQDDYKQYYSSLTAIVRGYLEEDASINALESTTTELIQKLELLRKGGTLALKPETISNLKNVLETADLVKFAQAKPGTDHASSDRFAIESVVVQTKEAIPEPTEEELLRDEAYRRELQKQYRKKQWKFMGISLASVVVLAFGVATYVYGFDQVKDRLLGNPTLTLLCNEWVTSTYGATPIRMTTPEILTRFPSEKPNTQTFRLGDIEDPFALTLRVEQITEEGDVEIDINARATELIQIFEAAGASNIFQKQDEYQTPSGVKGVTISGSFDWKTENKETVRKEYFVYYFAENSGLQQIEFVSNREDRYAKIIIDRLVDSFNFKTEVQ